MALIVCPECGGNVSDKASACPHCGYPLSKNIAPERAASDSVKPEKKENKGAIPCPKCKKGLIVKREDMFGAYVCDSCGSMWRASESIQPKSDESYPGEKESLSGQNSIPTLDEREKRVLAYIASKGKPVSSYEIQNNTGSYLTIRTTQQILSSLCKQHLIEKDKMGDYYLAEEKTETKTVQPLICSDDTSAKKYEATIQNMSATINAKDQVLTSAKNLLADNQYEDLVEKYKNFSDAFNNYYLSAINHYSALVSEHSAISAKKIDPAIAGGLAQGIAGVGAGVYTAVNQQQQNQLIDEARSIAKTEVRNASSAESFARKCCEGNYYAVMAYINSYPQLESLFTAERGKLIQKASAKKEAEKKDKRSITWVAIIVAIVMAILVFCGVNGIITIVIAMVLGIVLLLCFGNSEKRANKKISKNR